LELLKAMIAPPCLPATLFLGAICGYWVLVVVGWMDHSGLDLDADWDGLLSWLGWKDVPVAVCLSVVSLVWWSATMLAWHAFEPSQAWVLWASLIAFPISIFVSRVLVKPFGWFFSALSADEPHEPTTERFAILMTPLRVGQIGQAEIATRGSSLLLNVILERGEDLPKGARVVVAERREDGVHIVIPSSSPEIP